MPLFHRSRRYPPNINNSVRVDHEVPFDALWLQATSYDDEACCPRFGPHQLAITSRDILAFYNIERQPDLQLRLWHVLCVACGLNKTSVRVCSRAIARVGSYRPPTTSTISTATMRTLLIG
eukprot:TRINITY_DN8604_c0_g1_i6.p1 TRINITY_DN8604_c0_g1~~TRINITY_DN8604_c0_g1_i6.p1  ORF type:complete len:121 (+),score=9.38 TRINITY_DN8604_c0_g1_i6:97-459(+)